MEDPTVKIDNQNILTVRQEIEKKTSGKPYMASVGVAGKVITDMDHTPYSRFFRGVSYYDDPIIMEREAGWRQIRNPCYSLLPKPKEGSMPRHCYMAPCTTVYPCYAEYTPKFRSEEEMDHFLNQSCLVKNR